MTRQWHCYLCTSIKNEIEYKQHTNHGTRLSILNHNHDVKPVFGNKYQRYLNDINI